MKRNSFAILIVSISSIIISCGLTVAVFYLYGVLSLMEVKIKALRDDNKKLVERFYVGAEVEFYNINLDEIEYK